MSLKGQSRRSRDYEVRLTPIVLQNDFGPRSEEFFLNQARIENSGSRQAFRILILPVLASGRSAGESSVFFLPGRRFWRQCRLAQIMSFDLDLHISQCLERIELDRLAATFHRRVV
jgi:hypothetical protein